MGLLDDAVHNARLRVGADLLLFRKTLHALEGVVADVCHGDSLIDETLFGQFISHFAAEWPGRWLAFPTSRAFATRLSNLDIFQLMLSWPWTMAQLCIT